MDQRRLTKTCLLLLFFLLITLIPNQTIASEGNTGKASTAGHLVISEVYYNPNDEYNSEFIEFYNPTSEQIDLTNWDFQEKNGDAWKNFAASTDKQNELVVQPGGFLLLVDGGWTDSKDDSSWPDGDIVDEMSLTNGEGSIAIRNSDKVVIDQVNYAGDAADGQSVERKANENSTASSMRGDGADADLGNSYDTGQFANDFVGPLPPDPQNTGSLPEPVTPEDDPENEPPTADAGGPYYCSVGDTLTLDGSNSHDPDGTITNFEWDLNDDRNYGDLKGQTPSLTLETAGTVTIKLRVTDDEGDFATDETTITVESTSPQPSDSFHIELTSTNLPADGSSSTDILITNGPPGQILTVTTQSGVLSKDSVALDENGTGSLTLTTPQQRGATTLIVTDGKNTQGAVVYFHHTEDSKVIDSFTGVINEETTTRTWGSKNEFGAKLSLQGSETTSDFSAVSVGKYGDNPIPEPCLAGKNDMYLNLNSVNPTALSEIIVEIYLDPWPAEPRLKYWNSSMEVWTTCKKFTAQPLENRLKLEIDNETDPGLDDLHDFVLAAGGIDESETEIKHPGWNMVSVPIEPEITDPKELFSELGCEEIFTWNAGKNGGRGGYITTNGYYDEVKPFQGVWVYLDEIDTPAQFSMTGLYDGTVRVNLEEPGWHQVGLPTNYRWRDLGVSRKDENMTVSLLQGSDNGWLWRYVWEWDPRRGRYYTYGFDRGEKVLEYGRSYWINTKVPDLALVVPYGAPPDLPPLNCGTDEFGGVYPENSLPEPPPPPVTEPVTGKLTCLAYPNPTSATTGVKFEVEEEVSKTKVMVNDSAGNLIYDSGFLSLGNPFWSLVDDDGRSVPGGLYLYRVKALDKYGNRLRSGVKKLLVVN